MSIPTDWVNIPITLDEINYARYYKEVIDENNGIEGEYFTDPDSYQGFVVEFALSKLFGFARTHHTVNGTDKYDYMINDTIIDVKGGLCVNCRQYLHKTWVSYYVFGKVIGDYVIVYGWMNRDEVGKCRRKIKTAKYTPYYDIPIWKLHPMFGRVSKAK